MRLCKFNLFEHEKFLTFQSHHSFNHIKSLPQNQSNSLYFPQSFVLLLRFLLVTFFSISCLTYHLTCCLFLLRYQLSFFLLYLFFFVLSYFCHVSPHCSFSYFLSCLKPDIAYSCKTFLPFYLTFCLYFALSFGCPLAVAFTLILALLLIFFLL